MAGVRMLIAAREGAGLMEIEKMKRREVDREGEGEGDGEGERDHLWAKERHRMQTRI